MISQATRSQAFVYANFILVSPRPHHEFELPFLDSTATMPTATTKRILKDETPSSAKKRKVGGEVHNERLAKLSQTLPPSSFEEELGNLTEEIHALKDGNAETDQKWARPPLDSSWDSNKDSLVFQQIDVEEGLLNGKTSIRLFGVTEAHHQRLFPRTGY